VLPVAVVFTILAVAWTGWRALLDLEGIPDDVVRQRDAATASPVTWGRARSISDQGEMMAARTSFVKRDGVAGRVG
jgi:hypothetical protein